MMVEWTGRQQLLFLLQSGGLGFGLGFLFELFTASAFCGGRRRRFLLDAAFGVVAALVTFFGALAIMDGDFHPLLFAGIGVGFIAEHMGPGAFLRLVLVRVFRTTDRICGWSLDKVEGLLQKIPHFFKRRKPKNDIGEEIYKKNHKKFRFFQKNT